MIPERIIFVSRGITVSQFFKEDSNVFHLRELETLKRFRFHRKQVLLYSKPQITNSNLCCKEMSIPYQFHLLAFQLISVIVSNQDLTPYEKGNVTYLTL